VELSARMAADSSRAAEILVSAAPFVFRADWAVLVRLFPAPHQVFGTSGAPDLSLDVIKRCQPWDRVHRVVLPGDGQSHHAAVAGLADDQIVIIGRRGDPPFFGSELTRLAHLTGAAATADDVPGQSATPADPGPAHRRPVAPPLYRRSGERSIDAAPD
jgi:hypothetical protein